MISNLFKSIYEGIPARLERLNIETAVNNQKDSFSKLLVKGFEIDDRVLANTQMYKALDRVLKKVKSYRGKPVDFIVSIAERRVKDHDQILKAVERSFKETTLKDVITYDRVNVITYVTCADWFLDFAFAAISTMVSEAAYEHHENPYKSSVDKLNNDYVKNSGNQSTFAAIANLLDMEISEAMKKAAELEGITFNPDNIDRHVDQFGQSSVDGMKIGFMPVSINPFYWLGQIYNAWYDYRHKEIKEDIAMLKMKLYRLERLREGVPEDSDEIRQIDKQIEYNASRLAVLKEKLEDIREDV